MDAAEQAQRLAEVAAWVSFRWPTLGRRGALWSEELRPPDFPAHGTQPQEHGGIINGLLASPGHGSAAVEHIVRRRQELLIGAGLELPSRRSPLSPGRILVTDFNSDLCQVATEISNGFFDLEDVAPWDTWFAHVDTGSFGGIVGCWVPPAWIDPAQRGMDVMPIRSVWWDDSPPEGTPSYFGSEHGPFPPA
jgi:hypothetical protein